MCKLLQNFILKNTKTFELNTVVKFPNVYIDVKKVSFTPINTVINITDKYNKNSSKDYEYVQWFILDDNGDAIEQKGSSGYFDVKNSSLYDFKYECRFVSSKHVPRYLTVVPYKVGDDKGSYEIPPLYKELDNEYPIELSQGKIGKIIIKDVKMYKDKTIVKYEVKGEEPALQAEELYITDSEENSVGVKNNDFSIKRDKNNHNLYIMEFDPLDKSKKYKIGTNNLNHYDVREDLKFKINLKNK